MLTTISTRTRGHPVSFVSFQAPVRRENGYTLRTVGDCKTSRTSTSGFVCNGLYYGTEINDYRHTPYMVTAKEDKPCFLDHLLIKND